MRYAVLHNSKGGSARVGRVRHCCLQPPLNACCVTDIYRFVGIGRGVNGGCALQGAPGISIALPFCQPCLYPDN